MGRRGKSALSPHVFIAALPSYTHLCNFRRHISEHGYFSRFPGSRIAHINALRGRSRQPPRVPSVRSSCFWPDRMHSPALETIRCWWLSIYVTVDHCVSITVDHCASITVDHCASITVDYCVSTILFCCMSTTHFAADLLCFNTVSHHCVLLCIHHYISLCINDYVSLVYHSVSIVYITTLYLSPPFHCISSSPTFFSASVKPPGLC